MGWFNEQIKERINADEADFSQAFAELSGAVTGKRAVWGDAGKRAQDAIGEILSFYHVARTELPEGINDLNDQLEYLLRPAGVMRRVVELSGAWYKNAVGPMLCRTVEGDPVALIPAPLGYRFYHHASGRYVRVNKKTVKLLTSDALCFYKPLPLREVNAKDLLLYGLQDMSLADVLYFAAISLVAVLLGMLTPYVNQLIYSRVIPSGQMGLLLPVACMLLGVTVSTTLLGVAKALILGRIQGVCMTMQSAAMMRVLSLPADFFKKYSAGELSTRVQVMDGLCNMLLNAVLSTGLTSLFSLAYITQIARYSRALVLPALIVISATLLLSVLTSLMQAKRMKRQMEAQAKDSGLVFALFSGIQKIKLAGAERRAFAKWASGYKKVAEQTYDPPFLLKISGMLTTCFTLFGTIVIYYFAARAEISVPDYMAFNTAYGMLSAAFSSLAGIALTIANIKPVYSMVEPLLKAVPETAAEKKTVTRISGVVDVSSVSFRYKEDMPLILDDFSLHIRAGQYLAVVGKTGCGKSTLVRLLLGFEKPQKGAVYYDGKDIASLDLPSLRRHIGVVLQNGKLFQGNIFSNITISAPWLTMQDAWRAAEMAGIAEDIRRLPMGMHTVISEGGGGISGGQRQRLMIARAVAPDPKILIFDEATSALDNITQRMVSESLDALKCTRIVIAHRLSTIRQCDRIIVLEGGKIVEDGSYEELLAKQGFFAELVARQRLDEND